jgi:hypothetical protein
MIVEIIIQNTLYYVFGNKKTRSGSVNSVTFFSQNLFNLYYILRLHNKVFHVEKFHSHSVCS